MTPRPGIPVSRTTLNGGEPSTDTGRRTRLLSVRIGTLARTFSSGERAGATDAPSPRSRPIVLHARRSFVTARSSGRRRGGLPLRPGSREAGRSRPPGRSRRTRLGRPWYESYDHRRRAFVGSRRDPHAPSLPTSRPPGGRLRGRAQEGTGSRRPDAGAALGGAELGLSAGGRLRERATDALGVEILAVDRRGGLLPPGLVEPAGIDAVEADLVDELQDDRLRPGIVAGDGQGDSPGASLRPAALQERFRVDVVERLDDGPAQVLLHPTALEHPVLDLLDPPVALLRVIVAGLDDDHVLGDALEQVLTQLGDPILRNRHDHDVSRARRLLDGDRDGARLPGEAGQRLGAPRVGDGNLMPQAAEVARER